MIGRSAIIGLVTALLVGAGSAAYAAPVREHVGLSAEHDRCMASGDAARGVTVAILNCNGEELDRQDARLNAMYRKAMARLSPTRRARLRAAERLWLKERERRCTKAAEPEAGGTLASIIRSSCFVGETRDRADYLAAYR